MDVLKLEERELGQNTYQLRSNNLIPGVIFGKKMDSFPVSIQRADLVKALNSSGELYEIHTPSHKLQAKFAEIQYEPVSGKILHFSLMHLPKGETGKIEIPINFTGESVGAKAGGIFQTMMESIVIEALPKDFPQELICDISELEIGGNVTVANIQHDSNKIKLTQEDDKVIAICTAPAKVEEEPADDTIVLAGEDGAAAPAEEKQEDSE